MRVRLIGTPASVDFPLNYCFAVPAARRRCSTPTVPTAATVDDPERSEILVIEERSLPTDSCGSTPLLLTGAASIDSSDIETAGLDKASNRGQRGFPQRFDGDTGLVGGDVDHVTDR